MENCIKWSLWDSMQSSINGCKWTKTGTCALSGTTDQLLTFTRNCRLLHCRSRGPGKPKTEQAADGFNADTTLSGQVEWCTQADCAWCKETIWFNHHQSYLLHQDTKRLNCALNYNTISVIVLEADLGTLGRIKLIWFFVSLMGYGFRCGRW